MKKIITLLLLISMATPVFALPTVPSYTKSLFPDTTDTYELGTTTKQWLRGTFKEVCISGDCSTSFPSVFSTTSSDYWLTTKNTDSLTEGLSNLYWTIGRFTSALLGGYNAILGNATSTNATTTNLYVSGNTYLSSLTGPLQAINGLVSATNTLSIAYGGTGLSTLPSYGQVLLGNATGGYTLTATSELGLLSTETDPVWTSDKDSYFTLADWFGTTTAPHLTNWWSGLLAGTTTDALREGSNNLYYTQARVWDDTWASTTLATILNNSATAFGWGNHAEAGYLTNLLGGLNAILGNSTTTNATTTSLAITGLATPAGSVLAVDPNGLVIATTTGAGIGTVTSVDMSVPTGLTIAGNPITSAGTLALSLTGGYVIPKTASTTEWDTAYGWGNHAEAGYLTNLTGGLNAILGNSTTTNATTTNLYVSGDTTLGTLSGILKATSGSLSVASAGTDYVIPATLNNYLTLADWFGTTTAPHLDNWWSGLLAGTTTDALDEGDNNKYYTQARTWTDVWASTTLATILNNSVTAFSWGDHSVAGYLKNLTGGLNAILGNSTTTNATTTELYVSGNATFGSLTGILQSVNGLLSASSTISTVFGGTGLSTKPTYGQLLLGNSSGGYTLTATSALGLTNWKDGLYVYNPTSTPNTAYTTGGTDETLKIGNCLEPSGKSVTVTKVGAIVATTTSSVPDGVTWNMRVASSFSSTSPMSLFTSNVNTNATATQQSYSTFGQAIIPSGYCYWFTASAASSTVKGFNINLFGYENQ